MAAEAMRQSAAAKPRANRSKFFMLILFLRTRSTPPRTHAATAARLPRRRAALVVLVAAVARCGIAVQLSAAVVRLLRLRRGSRRALPAGVVAPFEAAAAAVTRAVSGSAIARRPRAELVAVGRAIRHVDVGPAAVAVLLPAVVGLAVDVAVVAGIDVAAPALGDRRAVAEAARTGNRLAAARSFGLGDAAVALAARCRSATFCPSFP